VSGDHILLGISPNITIWSGQHNLLEQYLASLDKVYALDVDLVLPGHRELFTDHRMRIQELKQHHEARVNEVLSILEMGGQTAYDIATRMTWDIDYKSWQHFPVSQRWFAVGEALAHLKYLEEKRRVVSEMHGHQMVFSLTRKKEAS
jgi:glyoxylase-like metal-dependent hydrolase (beta-lactamase superfamily II)